MGEPIVPRLKLKLRISSKLGVLAGLSVVLVAGMLTNEQVGLRLMNDSAELVQVNYLNLDNAQAAGLAMVRARIAVSELMLTDTVTDADKSTAEARAQLAMAALEFDAAEGRARRQQTKDIYRAAKAGTEAYLAATLKLAAAQKQSLAAADARRRASTSLNSAIAIVLASPRFVGLPNRRDVELLLHQANAAFVAARAAAWRFASTAETAQRELASREVDRAAALFESARGITADPEVKAQIELLSASTIGFRTANDAVMGATDLKNELRNNRIGPIAASTRELIDKGVKVAKDTAELRRGEFTAAMTHANIVGLAVGGLVIVVLIGSALVSMLDIARPLRHMGAVLLTLAQGETAVDIPYVDRPDEIGDAARSAETFRANVVEQQRLSVGLQDAVGEREAHNRAVETAVETFRATATEILAAFGDNAAAMRRTAENLSSISGDATKQAMSAAAASEQTATNVQTVACSTEELASSILEIGRQVQQATDVVRRAGATTDRSAGEIEALAAAGQKIGAVVDLIQAIAAQTNLLALNATIEAARAGDAGRGFAVVASEVKSLAGQTAKATEEIAHHVTSIQNSTTAAVEAVRDAAAAMKDIDHVTATIAGAVEEQSAATREISQNVQMASQGTQTLTVNISSVNGTIKETNNSAGAVLSASAAVASQADRMAEAVKAFFVALRTGPLDRRVGEDPSYKGPERRQDRQSVVVRERAA
jgi:methyl-accepting chemotaxis protein